MGSRFSAEEIATIFSHVLEDPVIAIPFYVVEPIFFYVGLLALMLGLIKSDSVALPGPA